MRLLMVGYYIITSLIMILLSIAALCTDEQKLKAEGIAILFFWVPLALHQIYYAHKDYTKHKLQKKLREQKYLQKKLKDLNTEIKEK